MRFDQSTLRDLWVTVRRRPWWFLVPVALTIGFVAQRVLREAPIYASLLTLRIEQTPNPIADAPPMAMQYDYRIDPLASQQQVIKSRTVAERAVQSLGISAPAAAHDLLHRIDTRVLPQTDIIEMTLVGPDSGWDRRMENAVAQVYAQYSREQAQLRARQRSQYIAHSLVDQASEMDRSRDSLRAFQERHQVADVEAEQTEAFKQIYKLTADREGLAVQQRVYTALIGKLETADSADDQVRALVATDSVAHNKTVTTLYDNWMDLVRTRERLLLTRTEQNADVQAVDSAIQATKRHLQLSGALYLKSLNARIASLDSNLTELRDETGRYPPMVAEQARLAAVVKTRETEYASLLSQYQLAKISEGGETGAVRILDSAEVLPDPVAPHPVRALVFAAIVGIMLGLAAATMADRIDDSVQTPDEVRDALQLPILGSIPRVRGGRRSRALRGGNPSLPARRAIVHVEPQSIAAEAFRSVRTNLVFARAHQDLRTVLVTSAVPGDGKSTAATNIATTFAQQGQRTVLIDADLRRATLDGVFGVPREPGLSDVLVGRARLEDVVKETSVPNLSVITSGVFPPNPSELLGSPRMRAVMEEAKALFDMVIIDSPPVLAVTDASVLASLADGTLVVVRLGQTRREAVRRAVGQVRAVHGQVLGTVLNDVTTRQDPYYGGYGYYSDPA